nr:hypothetical protein GCM10020093_083110 [Planobispora longispora]
MRVTITRPDGLGAAELALWRSWQAPGSGLDSPFLAPDFALAIDRARKDVRVEIAVFEDGSGLAGFLPTSGTAARWAGPSAWGSPTARAWSTGPAPGPPAGRPGGRLALGLGVRPPPRRPAAPPRARRRARGLPVMDLSEGYDPYRDARRALTRSAIGGVERKDRKLGREHGELRLEYGCRDPEMLRLMMRWKSAHYRRTGAADRFGWPWVRQLVEESFATATEEYGGLLSTLHAGDTPVAVEFGLRSGTVYERWFGAYDADAFGAYSRAWS